MYVKVAQNDSTRKMNDFDTFAIIVKNVDNLGKIIVATSAINRLFWSY